MGTFCYVNGPLACANLLARSRNLCARYARDPQPAPAGCCCAAPFMCGCRFGGGIRHAVLQHTGISCSCYVHGRTSRLRRGGVARTTRPVCCVHGQIRLCLTQCPGFVRIRNGAHTRRKRQTDGIGLARVVAGR
jgi:hypothetical protein